MALLWRYDVMVKTTDYKLLEKTIIVKYHIQISIYK